MNFDYKLNQKVKFSLFKLISYLDVYLFFNLFFIAKKNSFNLIFEMKFQKHKLKSKFLKKRILIIFDLTKINLHKYDFKKTKLNILLFFNKIK